MVKANGLTYKFLKKQIELDIKNKEMDWSEQYPYRLNQIDIFDGYRITKEEAIELREMIEPFKPVEESTEEQVDESTDKTDDKPVDEPTDESKANEVE